MKNVFEVIKVQEYSLNRAKLFQSLILAEEFMCNRKRRLIEGASRQLLLCSKSCHRNQCTIFPSMSSHKHRQSYQICITVYNWITGDLADKLHQVGGLHGPPGRKPDITVAEWSSVPDNLSKEPHRLAVLGPYSGWNLEVKCLYHKSLFLFQTHPPSRFKPIKMPFTFSFIHRHSGWENSDSAHHTLDCPSCTHLTLTKHEQKGIFHIQKKSPRWHSTPTVIWKLLFFTRPGCLLTWALSLRILSPCDFLSVDRKNHTSGRSLTKPLPPLHKSFTALNPSGITEDTETMRSEIPTTPTLKPPPPLTVARCGDWVCKLAPQLPKSKTGFTVNWLLRASSLILLG